MDTIATLREKIATALIRARAAQGIDTCRVTLFVEGGSVTLRRPGWVTIRLRGG